ncbi:hypothetical protein EV03_1916 [Prochlorococcus marinus str. PAC1]|uniref:Uncharacterized protein n=1 Tax=Prochlorococcus marinus str. PAC1 TaxID=59924 RepID=A0A0A2BZN2_PROMR|nr:hypothetical protein EV03_1916 [Prochlorococcus marinus str. PAC1]
MNQTITKMIYNVFFLQKFCLKEVKIKNKKLKLNKNQLVNY